ncbi:uncharacterized protein LOC144661338 isoform X1 [Oculina patagonica]
MAKLQVAFWLLVAFTVMLKVEGGDLYRRMGFFDEPLFDDADRLKDVYNSELSSEGCADYEGWTRFCIMFQSHCQQPRLGFVHSNNYRLFHSRCRRTCGEC